MLHKAAIKAVLINAPILLIIRFRLFLKSIGKLLMASLTISTSMHPAIKPKIAEMNEPNKIIYGFGISKK